MYLGVPINRSKLYVGSVSVGQTGAVVFRETTWVLDLEYWYNLNALT